MVKMLDLRSNVPMLTWVQIPFLVYVFILLLMYFIAQNLGSRTLAVPNVKNPLV